MREPAVVSSPRVQRMSLRAIGTPCEPAAALASKRRPRPAPPRRAFAGSRAAHRRPLDRAPVGLGQLEAGDLTGVEQLDAAFSSQAERVALVMTSAAPGRCRPGRRGVGEHLVPRPAAAPCRAASRSRCPSACAVGGTPAQVEPTTAPRRARGSPDSCSTCAPPRRRSATAGEPGNVQHVVGGDRHRWSRIADASGAGSRAPAPRRQRPLRDPGRRQPSRGRRWPAAPCCPGLPRTRPAGPRSGSCSPRPAISL